MPNPVADVVLLDGPDQYAPANTVRGFSTGDASLMPLAADLLVVEHFFEPGAVILVDGRAANARFLRRNFERPWSYQYFEEGDFHIFELDEEPLGKINAKRVDRLSPLLSPLTAQ